MKYCLAMVLLLLTANAIGETDMYSWVDANGVKHFSDSPPPRSVKAKKMVVHGGVGAGAGAVTDAPPEQAATDSGPALAAAAGYAPQDIKRNCDIAQMNLSTLQLQKPRLDGNGNPVDAAADATHQSQVEKANQQIKLFCSAK